MRLQEFRKCFPRLFGWAAARNAEPAAIGARTPGRRMHLEAIRADVVVRAPGLQFIESQKVPGVDLFPTASFRQC